jgi:mono/diheme cytochrome c family protein
MICWRICIRSNIGEANSPGYTKDNPICRFLEEENLKSSIRLSMVASAAVVLLLAGCHHAPKSKPVSQLTPAEAQGHQIFQQNCSVCHYSNSIQLLKGPGLQGLFQKPYLPSGAPATDQRVRSTILHGRNIMPPFVNVLSDQQLHNLLAYLHTI